MMEPNKTELVIPLFAMEEPETVLDVTSPLHVVVLFNSVLVLTSLTKSPLDLVPSLALKLLD